MGVTFDCNMALVFDDGDAADDCVEYLESVKRLRDGHCDGDVTTTVYDLDVEEREGHWVITFGSCGYGSYDLSEIKMRQGSFDHFVGWVQSVYSCQSDNIYHVMDGDGFNDDFNIYGCAIQLEDWDDYPQQADFQTMEDDEVVDDEEAYEDACYDFRDNICDRLTEEYESRIANLCGE